MLVALHVYQTIAIPGCRFRLPVDDVADMLRINKSTVYRMAKGGRLPATRVGRQWRFRLSALEKFLDAGGDLAFEQNQEEGLKKVVNRW
jgi:excisionase family DNA binding protein